MTEKQNKSSLLLIVGGVILLFPLFTTISWILVFNQLDSHAERVAAFNSIIPVMLRPPTISLFCALVSMVCGAVCVLRLTGYRRLLATGLCGVAGALSVWFVWTLL